MTASDSKSVPLAEDVPEGLKPGSLSGQGGPLRLAALAQSGLIPYDHHSAGMIVHP